MLVVPATLTGYLSGRTSNVYGAHRDSIEFGNLNAIRLLNLDPAGERNIKRRILSRDEGLMGRSEEHTSEQSLMRISYAVFCLKKKNKTKTKRNARTYNKR